MHAQTNCKGHLWTVTLQRRFPFSFYQPTNYLLAYLKMKIKQGNAETEREGEEERQRERETEAEASLTEMKWKYINLLTVVENFNRFQGSLPFFPLSSTASMESPWEPEPCDELSFRTVRSGRLLLRLGACEWDCYCQKLTLGHNDKDCYCTRN